MCVAAHGFVGLFKLCGFIDGTVVVQEGEQCFEMATVIRLGLSVQIAVFSCQGKLNRFSHSSCQIIFIHNVVTFH